MQILNFLTEPLAHTFMQHALISSIAVGAVCAVLSCYVVLKGWSLMGDAISHGVLPGVVVASVLGVPYMAGAFVAGLICAVSVGFLKNNTRIKEDTLMGVVFSTMFAFGLVAFTKLETDQHLTHILFGNLLGISKAVLWQTVAVSLVILAIMLIKRKDFLLYAFDMGQARVVGLSINHLHYGLLVLLCATIVVAMSAVGVILVVAMLIAPGITAFLLTKRFDVMLMLAVLSSVFSSTLGVLASFHLDSATGATIVLTQAVVFIMALMWRGVQTRFASRVV